MDIFDGKEALHSAARMSTVLALATFCMVIFAIASVAWLFLAPQVLGTMLAPRGWVGPVTFTHHQLVALLTLSVVGFAGWAIILWWARSMFSQLVAGAPGLAAQFARKTSLGLWLMVPWQIAAPAVAWVIATLHLPGGQQSLIISLGFGHAGTLLSALIASSVARALEFGVELWRDHKEIV